MFRARSLELSPKTRSSADGALEDSSARNALRAQAMQAGVSSLHVARVKPLSARIACSWLGRTRKLALGSSTHGTG